MHTESELDQGVRPAVGRPFRRLLGRFSPRGRLGQRLGRLGVLGFMFFLIKGLLWLVAPALLVWWRSHNG